MTRNEEMKALLERTSFQLSGSIKGMLFLFVAIGAVAFIVGLLSGHPEKAWQALLINTIFFGSISFGGLAFSLIWTITDAKWSRPLKRLAEATFAFVPVLGVLYIILFFGSEHFFEWYDHDNVIHSKEGWLNMGFFVKRNIFMFLLAMGLGWVYIKRSLRPDIGLAKSLTGFSNPFADRIVKNYGSQEEEQEKTFMGNHYLAPAVAFLLVLFTTVIAFDWMMSIDQEWFSTMFGVQYLVASLIAGGCFIAIVAGFAKTKLGLEDYITTVRYHDIVKFIFAFCLLWTYMCFSQVITIWYGNLPEETPFMILRMMSHEWGWMFWVIMVMMFIIPYFGLMPRTVCNSVWASRIIAIEILVGLWLEKFFMIVPSMQENAVAEQLRNGTAHGAHGGGHGGMAGPVGLPGFEYNMYDFALTLGLGGAFLLCYFWFLARVPVVPISDKHFFKDPSAHH